MFNLHSVTQKYEAKEKKIETCQKFSLTIVSPYLEFAMEAVFIPLLIKSLDKLPLLTCSANTDFG